MADLFPPPGLVLPKPDWGFKESPDADVIVEKMGDGYEVRTPNGLNHIKDTLSPTWSSLDPDVGVQAYEFLKSRLNWKSVMWEHPLNGRMLKVVPQQLSITYDTWGNAVLDVQFRQDFNPG